MKKNILLLVFVLLTSTNYTGSVSSYNNTAQVSKVIEVAKSTWTVSQKRTRSIWVAKKEENKKYKVTKKDLKEEIKKRKKYHKSLLSTYNESFDQKYLELIAFNSQRISDLKKNL